MYAFVDINMYLFAVEITLHLTRRCHYNVACTLAPKKKVEYWEAKK